MATTASATAAPYTNGAVNGTTTNGAGPSNYPLSPPSTHLATSTTSSASASTADGAPSPSYNPPPSHNDIIVNHIYTEGFQLGNYADINLYILNHHYRLHAIILIRSPYLANLIKTSQTNSIYVPLEDQPLINEEGMAIALGFLYSSISTTLVNPSNARSVLAAACLLGGMEDLCQIAYEVCKDSISLENIASWIQFLQPPTPSRQPSGSVPSTPITTTSSVPGTPIVESRSLMPPSFVTCADGPLSVLGPFAQRLYDDVLNFLTTTLPLTLQAFAIRPPPSPGSSDTAPPASSGYEQLLQVYTLLPFEIFKAAVEAPSLPIGIGGDHARFRFAKEAIAMRKKERPNREEESVVLAFGKVDGGSAVHVARKMKKRPLWKVAK